MIWVLLLASGARALSPTDQAKVLRIVQAYAAFLKGVEGDELVWRDETRMPLTRAKAASYTALLNQPGLLDQLDAAYPSCVPVRPPARNEDPGRVRFEPPFKKMYGASPSQVASKLVPPTDCSPWMIRFRITSVGMRISFE